MNALERMHTAAVKAQDFVTANRIALEIMALNDAEAAKGPRGKNCRRGK